jgi:gamma-glutamylcyclotransferase (GGCT)/AIG2-like uncharacterized protein YtfP
VKTRIFVYGSLLRGEGNNRRLAGDDFVREATARGRLYSLFAFPGARFDQSGTIHGEVYDVSEQSLMGLDFLEGYDPMRRKSSHYTREKIKLDDGEEVYSYQYNQDLQGLPVVVNGDWRNPKPDRIKQGGYSMYNHPLNPEQKS